LLSASLDAHQAPKQRAAAAAVLDSLDWLPAGLFEYIKIPAQPQPELKPPEFYIARYPTTNLQYERFLTKENFADPSLWMDFPKYDENSQLIENASWGDGPWLWLQRALQDPDRSPDGAIVYPSSWHDPRFGIARKTP
jgi:hypothetical protein